MEKDIKVPQGLEEFFNEFHQIYVDGLREQLKIPDDWEYRRINTTMENYSKLLDIVQEENISIVSGHTKALKDKDTIIVSASLFVSPAGIQNVKDYRNENSNNQ